jgi:hypothetical protein
MAVKKTHDLAVKTGSYVDREGNSKGRYVNIGNLWQKDDGSEFMTILRTFNPAGVPNPENKDSIVISRFEIRDKNTQQGSAPQGQAAPQRQPRPTAAQAPAGGGFADMDDDIPF